MTIPFTIVLALLPLIGYLTVIGMVRVSGRVLVTTGGRDTAALGIAICGFMAVGPAELFFPHQFATVFGPLVWVALATFYALCVALVALTGAPKLVVYGRTPDELFEPLLRAAQRIDAAAKGDESTLSVTLPAAKIHLRLDGQRGVDCAQVTAFEPGVSLRFWSLMLGNLRTEVRQSPAPLPRRGFGMLLAATVLGGILVWQGFGYQELVVEGFREWLWR
ncbi:MAG: hypothetical protein AAF497_26760 [Planctomycetota bacterium]